MMEITYFDEILSFFLGIFLIIIFLKIYKAPCIIIKK